MPSERLEWSDMPVSADTISSGALVPNPIITMPTTNGDTPKARASTLAPSTNQFALQLSRYSPPKRNSSATK